jgi:hypothetical protein
MKLLPMNILMTLVVNSRLYIKKNWENRKDLFTRNRIKENIQLLKLADNKKIFIETI